MERSEVWEIKEKWEVKGKEWWWGGEKWECVKKLECTGKNYGIYEELLIHETESDIWRRMSERWRNVRDRRRRSREWRKKREIMREDEREWKRVREERRGEELGESAQMASRYAVSPSGATHVPTNYSSGEGVSDDKSVVSPVQGGGPGVSRGSPDLDASLEGSRVCCVRLLTFFFSSSY